jgi:4-hydroxybutyrate CoA-transferase
MVQVTPPDKDGYCSFGVSVEHYPSLVEAAPLAVAEINGKMPRTCGDSLIHESAFDYVVEQDHPLPEYRVSPPGHVERAIGEHCARIIADGAVLQFGPGKISSAVLKGLAEKKDLGVHSGLINDVVMDLMDTGCLTGNSKTVDTGKIVCTSAIGTRKLYDFIADNPDVEFHPASYTHDVGVIREINNFCSLNVALQVDLLGQANSETINGRIVNGVGGMVDFIRGARESDGGRVVFCLPSSAGAEKESRIVRHFPEEAPVTVTRADIDYIVSEFGIAEMTGKGVRERAEAIRGIAAPEFRNALREPEGNEGFAP